MYHWTDTSSAARAARGRLRWNIRHGFEKPQTDETAKAPERFPQEYFKCRLCDSGPWHITWGGICPNCSGAS